MNSNPAIIMRTARDDRLFYRLDAAMNAAKRYVYMTNAEKAEVISSDGVHYVFHQKENGAYGFEKL